MLCFIFTLLLIPALSQDESSLLFLNRPNVYFGVRARVPSSPLFGVMWYNADIQDAADHIRHDCDERDKFSRYGWTRHDGRNFGVQELADQVSGVNLTAEFVKYEDDDVKENWVARFSGEAIPGEPSNRNISFIWYLSTPGKRHSMKLLETDDAIYVGGKGSEVGPYTLIVPAVHSNKHPTVIKPSSSKRTKHIKLDESYTLSAAMPKDQVWNVKEIVRTVLLEEHRKGFNLHHKRLLNENPEQQLTFEDFPLVVPTLPNKSQKSSNVLAVQQFVTVPFSFEMVFTSQKFNKVTKMSLEDAIPAKEDADELLKDSVAEFDRKFDNIFGLAENGYSEAQQRFAKAALSNMLGGIGYFYGKSQILPRGSEEVVWTKDSSLYCTVPSRSFFPRGFMWDEGFHQFLVSKWDIEISLEIITSWYNLIDKEGWLGREQILGEEARSRVPEQFQVQKPDVANPPTIILAIHSIMKQQKLEEKQSNIEKLLYMSIDASGHADEAKQETEWLKFLKRIYPKLKLHVDWFFKTQTSQHDKNSFTWRGCTLDGCLPSGLDDYPRVPYLTDTEGHVDLHSWMIILSQTMEEISHELGFEEDENYFHGKSEALLASLLNFHWDPASQSFQDYAVHPNTSETEFMNFNGYVSLFPFLLTVLHPNDARLLNILEQLSSREGMWTDWGVRSLGEDDKLFGTGNDYWRGSIWINVNYLTVSALYRYSNRPHQTSMASDIGATNREVRALATKLYKELRENLITNIFSEYERTGYLWEQYNAKHGKGQRSHPFTGWTSLIVNIMAETY